MDKNSALASFYNFLSVIFGILRKFGIEIGEQNIFIEKKIVEKIGRKFVEKKSWSKFFLGRKIFRSIFSTKK